MSKDKLRAAVVGLGFIGAGDQVSGDAIGQQVVNLAGTHAESLARSPGVDLVAGSSRDEGRRRRFTERTGVASTYSSWREMLEKESLDIVSVATYSPYHSEITIACAEAGVRAVFCEKPVATSLADADRMLASCAAHRTALVVNHTRRWDPLFTRATALIADNALGRLHHGLVRWPAGRLGNIGTHAFDALRLLLGREARSVTGGLHDTGLPDCRGAEFRDPGGWGVILFDGEVKVFVDASESIESPVPLTFAVAGSEGELILDGRSGRIRRWGEEWEPLELEPEKDNPMDRAVAEIAAYLRGGPVPVSTGEDGRAALEMIMAFHVSARDGSGPAELPLGGADVDIEVMIG